MCNSLEERSSPLRSAALHLSTLAEIVIRSVLNAAFPRINLRPVAAFCIISQSNHVHNQILRYYSSLQSLYIFQNAFFFQSFVPDSFPKKKETFIPTIIHPFIVQISTIHETDLSRHTYLTFSRISSLEKWIARRLIAAPPQRDIRGFETSTAIKRIIAGGFFFSGWKREERKKKEKTQA